MKKHINYQAMSTLVSHFGEFENGEHAHVMPIYQSSTFSFEDASKGAEIAAGKGDGYYYTRLGNPNFKVLTDKVAALEAWDFLQANPEAELQTIAQGLLFGSGMAAVTSAILACVHNGESVITQRAVYDGTYLFFSRLAPQYGIDVVWVDDNSTSAWRAAFEKNPKIKLAYIETPANPAMGILDIKAIAEIAHQNNAKVMVDNTFATPYCQRPLSLGADIVIHSTTKYLSGHGHVIGGVVVSQDVEYINGPLRLNSKILGATPSPFDAWLTNIGLKTFSLRMHQHCANAMKVAKFLERHPKVLRVYYPGLQSHPDHHLAVKQMHDFGGMMSFELKGGLEAGEKMMNHVKVATLAVSLGNVDTLIQHPASMTHRNTPREIRYASGITDGLVRLSVGIEDTEDIMADLDQAMR